MQQVIREYASAAVALLGAALFFGILGGMLLSWNGLLAKLVMVWGNGGC